MLKENDREEKSLGGVAGLLYIGSGDADYGADKLGHGPPAPFHRGGGDGCFGHCCDCHCEYPLSGIRLYLCKGGQKGALWKEL